jgi:hypothetical protein
MGPLWTALALQAAQSGGAPDPPPAHLAELQVKPILPPNCSPSGSPDDIVVCGRPDRRDSQRLEPLDPRFENERPPDGRFVRRLSETATIEGGGPKGSFGITLRVKF